MNIKRLGVYSLWAGWMIFAGCSSDEESASTSDMTTRQDQGLSTADMISPRPDLGMVEPDTREMAADMNADAADVVRGGDTNNADSSQADASEHTEKSLDQISPYCIEERDDGDDGTIESITYVKRDALARVILQEVDDGADDTIDSQFRYAYDEEGNIIETAFDFDGDMAFDSITTTQWENGMQTRAERDDDEDEDPDYIWVWTYEDGRLVRYEADAGGDGIIDNVTRYEYSRDGLERMLFESRDGDNETIERRIRQLFAEIAGQRVIVEIDQDLDNDGVYNRSIRREYNERVLRTRQLVYLGESTMPHQEWTFDYTELDQPLSRVKEESTGTTEDRWEYDEQNRMTQFTRTEKDAMMMELSRNVIRYYYEGCRP